MRGDEKRGAANAIGDAVSELSGVIEDMHTAINEANLRPFGKPGRLISQAQNTHAAGIYSAVRGIAQVATASAGIALEAATPDDAKSMADERRGTWMLSGLSSAFGDSMRRANNALAPHMSIRIEGREVHLDVESISEAFPNASEHIVLFIHGLASNEFAWGTEDSFANRLADELGTSAVFIRYNSGVHVSDNGEELAALLNDLAWLWPTDVKRLTLIGHSMGALAIHRACEVGLDKHYMWVELVDDVFCLGAPHRGSAWERSANVVINLIDSVPVTKPLARLANRRSDGIKDLRHGSVSPQDHARGDHSQRFESDHIEVTLLPNANYHFVSARVVTPDSSLSPLSNAIGDIMVTPVSATGQSWSGKRRPLPVESAHTIDGLSHVGLMTDDRVYTLIRNAMVLSSLPRQSR